MQYDAILNGNCALQITDTHVTLIGFYLKPDPVFAIRTPSTQFQGTVALMEI